MGAYSRGALLFCYILLSTGTFYRTNINEMTTELSIAFVYMFHLDNINLCDKISNYFPLQEIKG